MKRINEVYFQILTAGLVAVRTAAEQGDLKRCRAEAEHLHNVPSLIDEPNIARHRYYLEQERTAYLDWVSSTNRPELVSFAEMQYGVFWKELEQLVGAIGKG